MENKFFLHRIQKENGAFSKGVEVHNTLGSAKLSFWGRMKTAYGKNPAITYVSCKITDGNGNVVRPFDMTWKADSETENAFFLHHIRLDGATFDKDIDVLNSFDTARGDFAAQMEYGYNNPRFPGVSIVSCMITDFLSGGMVLMDETWVKPEEPVQQENL